MQKKRTLLTDVANIKKNLLLTHLANIYKATYFCEILSGFEKKNTAFEKSKIFK